MSLKRRTHAGTSQGPPPSAFAEVAKFSLGALAVLAALALGVGLILRDISEDEAIEQAERVTEVLARAEVEPAIDPGLLTGDPESRARVDRIVRDQVLGPDVVRVKIWTRDGLIVYSDEPRLIGAQYPLGNEEIEALNTGGGDAELSDLSEPENRFDRGHVQEQHWQATTTRWWSRPGSAPAGRARKSRQSPMMAASKSSSKSIRT